MPLAKEILIKKQLKGRVDKNELAVIEFCRRFDIMTAHIMENGRVTKDIALELIQKLDSVESINQEQIDEICQKFCITFKSPLLASFRPCIVPASDLNGWPFDFIFQLGTYDD